MWKKRFIFNYNKQQTIKHYIMTDSNPNDFKTVKEAMAFVKDFMDTPYEELIEKAENGEEGYGIMTDPDPIDDFYEDTTLEELKDLLKNAAKPGICHTKSNIAKRQYREVLESYIELKEEGYTAKNC